MSDHDHWADQCGLIISNRAVNPAEQMKGGAREAAAQHPLVCPREGFDRRVVRREEGRCLGDLP